MPSTKNNFYFIKKFDDREDSIRDENFKNNNNSFGTGPSKSIRRLFAGEYTILKIATYRIV